MTGDDVSDGLGDNAGDRRPEIRGVNVDNGCRLDRRGIWFRGREERLQSNGFEEGEFVQRRARI
jgi:hypothetical protein